MTFQYSLNILKQYMYITTSTEKRIRYSVTMRTIQYGLVNSAMGQIPCSTERISCSLYFLSYLFASLPVYFLTYLSTSSRIDSFRFQAGGVWGDQTWLYFLGFFVAFDRVLQYQPRDWLGRTSPKWSILCQVEHKTLIQSIYCIYLHCTTLSH